MESRYKRMRRAAGSNLNGHCRVLLLRISSFKLKELSFLLDLFSLGVLLSDADVLTGLKAIDRSRGEHCLEHHE